MIAAPFFISSHEVTFEQFCEFRKEHRGLFKRQRMPRNEEPVFSVTWFDCMKFCRWLSEREGIRRDQMCYPPEDEIKEGMKLPIDFQSRTGYRLPMEKEWEYACRAGATASRFFGNDEGMLPRYGWFIENAHGHPEPHGKLLPNDFGLFDILGNIKEWCQDVYKDDLAVRAAAGNVVPPDLGAERVVRGGGFSDQARQLRAANRYPSDPTTPAYSIGFRIVKTVRIPK